MGININKWIVGAALLLASTLLHSEGGCPPGMIPHSGTDISSCGPIPEGYNQSQGHWVTQWGAMAQGDDGTTGFSSNQPTKEVAKRAAINTCEVRGGRHCVVDDGYVYYNSCLAVVGSTDSTGKGWTDGYIAHTYNDAVNSAIKACKSDGKIDCKLFRAECSPAIWVDD